MSVAFRRDSDEEHLEPKFELPIPSGPNLVTRRGLAKIQARVQELQVRIEATGDDPTIALLQRDLRFWQTRQITAEVPATPRGEKVELGTRVRVLLNGSPKTFEIVGADEADPKTGLISFNAPLSRAMLSAEVGDILPLGGISDALVILGIAIGDSAVEAPSHP